MESISLSNGSSCQVSAVTAGWWGVNVEGSVSLTRNRSISVDSHVKADLGDDCMTYHDQLVMTHQIQFVTLSYYHQISIVYTDLDLLMILCGTRDLKICSEDSGCLDHY